jgi:hypothetical protein
VSTSQGTPLAEAADRRWQLLALAMLLIACKAGISAAMVLADATVRTWLDWAEMGAALGALVIVLWLLFFKFMKVPAHLRRRFLDIEGFVATTIQKSFKLSWLVTFVTMTILAPASKRFATVPAEFFVQALMALMLGVFSVGFFVMNATGGGDEGIADA